MSQQGVTLADVSAPSYTCPKCTAVSYNTGDITRLYCGRCHTYAEDLRNEPVTMFAHLTPIPLTRRDCFSLALLTLLDATPGPVDEARLVHGWVRDSWHEGDSILHAWCEFPGIGTLEDGSEVPLVVLVDHTQLDARARFIPREFAYEAMGVDETRLRRFTLKEALVNAMSYGCDGPWPENAT